MHFIGDSQSAFILRNLNSTDFRYDTGKAKLLALDLETLGHQSVLYTSVADEMVNEADGFGGEENSKQARLMRLGTLINLDSRLTVRHQIQSIFYIFLTCDRSGVLERFLEIFNGGERLTIYQTILMPWLGSE